MKETWAAEGEQEKTEVDNLTSIQLLHLAMALNQDTKMDGDKTIGDPTEIALIEYVNEKMISMKANSKSINAYTKCLSILIER